MALQLEVTHSVIQGALGNKKSFDPATSLSQLKEKLHMIVGTEPRFQKLQLKDPETDVLIMELEDDSLSLSDYGAQKDWILHVIDTDPARTLEQYTDEAVNKATVEASFTDAAYDKKDGTYRQWRKDQGLRVRDINTGASPASPAQASPAVKKGPRGAATKPGKVHVGDKCVDRDQKRPGTVRFIGTTEFGTGWWVGVEFDEPLGKNDGSLEGVRYFDCKPKHGSFLPADKVDVTCCEEDDCAACQDHCCDDC